MRNSERLEAGLDLVAQKLREGQDVAILACGGAPGIGEKCF